MPSVTKTFTFVDDGATGQIQKAGLIYTIDTDLSNQPFRVGFWGLLPKTEGRCYARYDTAEIPDDAEITKVEFQWRISSSQGFPLQWQIGFHIGTWIGAGLDSADWRTTFNLNSYTYPGGTPVGVYVWEPTPTATAIASVNKSGFTEVEYRDTSAASGRWWQMFSFGGFSPSLIVTYDAKLHPSQRAVWTP